MDELDQLQQLARELIKQINRVRYNAQANNLTRWEAAVHDLHQTEHQIHQLTQKREQARATQ